MKKCKKLNQKGFTLAELLVVVAIISVLAGTAIPVFNNAVQKAEHAVELANVRTAYAEAVVDAMTEEDYDGTISIDLSVLEDACSNERTEVLATDDSTIEVVLGNYRGSFDIDSDVSVIE